MAWTGRRAGAPAVRGVQRAGVRVLRSRDLPADRAAPGDLVGETLGHRGARSGRPERSSVSAGPRRRNTRMCEDRSGTVRVLTGGPDAPCRADRRPRSGVLFGDGGRTDVDAELARG